MHITNYTFCHTLERNWQPFTHNETKIRSSSLLRQQSYLECTHAATSVQRLYAEQAHCTSTTERLTHPSRIPNPSELTTQSAAASKRTRIPPLNRSPEGPIPPHSNSQTPGIGRETARRPRLLARVYGPGKRIR